MNCSIETFMKLDCFALLFCFILLCYMTMVLCVIPRKYITTI